VERAGAKAFLVVESVKFRVPLAFFGLSFLVFFLVDFLAFYRSKLLCNGILKLFYYAELFRVLDM
jgi:hypothetical protein